MTTPDVARAIRAAQAERARRRRLVSGQTRSTLVDLAALGRFLESLTTRQLAAFIDLVGENVARRALWAAAQPLPEPDPDPAPQEATAPEMVRPVAG